VRLLLALVLASTLAAPPTLADIEDEVVCPTCKTPLELSDSPAAERMRVFIRERIAAGDSKEEIKAKLVEEFGPRALAEPQKRGFDLLAWALPLGGIVLAAGAVGAVAWRWRRSADRAESDPTSNGRAPVEPDLERRLDEELARFDG
jgi:cytochrome c-type biogenesis protein CcmH